VSVRRLLKKTVDSRTVERVYAKLPFTINLQKEVRPDFTIGIAVFAYGHPEYLKLSLDSLFQTKLYDYNVTFLIQGDQSQDAQVRSIVELDRNPQFKIIRDYIQIANNSWMDTFNKAIRKLIEIDEFDIIGFFDSNVLFHPEWLDATMKVCLWAKRHHKEHILGPFSSFNSCDDGFHRPLGTYSSPFGNYVVKRRMGAINYLYFKDDLLKLFSFKESNGDETLMTRRFDELRVRNFCTETSYIEHIGENSILDRWRPLSVGRNIVYGRNLVKSGWPEYIDRIGTLGYYKSVKKNASSGNGVRSDVLIDVLIPVIEKDSEVLPCTLESIRTHLKHPVGRIVVVAPESAKIRAICSAKEVDYVSEESVLPIAKKDIGYVIDGKDRSGWVLQQLLKWSGEALGLNEHYLVLDADTVLIRPQAFEVNGKFVYLHSDEHHAPYFEVYRKLFGINTLSHLSFVSHQMLLSQTRLAEFKQQIETRHRCEPWYKVLLSVMDKSKSSAISEYELYGHWMLQNHSNEMIREYWFNRSMPRSRLHELPRIEKEFSDKYRSISFHHYLTPCAD
jgi:hypothetical protein